MQMCGRFRRPSTRAFWKCTLERARASDVPLEIYARPHYPNEHVTFEKRIAIFAENRSKRRYWAFRRRLLEDSCCIGITVHRSAEGQEDNISVNWLRVITGPCNARLIFNAGGGDGFTRANELVVLLFYLPLFSSVSFSLFVQWPPWPRSL